MRIFLIISVLILGACTRPPESRQVQINSRPAGAVVWLDGENVGITPTTVAMSGDRVVLLRLAMRDHQDWTTRLDPAAASQVQASLTPKPLASITFNTTPPGAELMLNGERRGLTPLTLGELVPGSYELRCQLENFEPHVETIEIDNADTISREIALVDKLVNFYQAQIDVEETPETLTSYTDLAHQLFVTSRTEEACGILLDGLMEMYRRGTKDTRLVAELDRTLSGQYFREGTRSEIRARIVGILRGRFDLIQEPSAKDLRAYILVLVLLKEYPLAKTELETALAFFPEDKGMRKLNKEVMAEIAPAPLTEKEKQAKEVAVERYRVAKNNYSEARSSLERARRSKLQADNHLAQTLKRRETAKTENIGHRESLAELAPKIEKLEIEVEAFEAEKKAMATNTDQLDYQALRRAMHAILDKMSSAESALASDKAETQRIETAIKDNESFSTHYKKNSAAARAAVVEADANLEATNVEFEQVKVAYTKAKLKHYDIVYKKKKRK